MGLHEFLCNGGLIIKYDMVVCKILIRMLRDNFLVNKTIRRLTITILTYRHAVLTMGLL